MRRGTTPTLLIKLKGIQREEIDRIYFSLKQGSIVLTLNEFEYKNGAYQFPLTQEQTLSFREGSIQCQARIAMQDGTIIATPIKVVSMCEILYEEVI